MEKMSDDTAITEIGPRKRRRDITEDIDESVYTRADDVDESMHPRVNDNDNSRKRKSEASPLSYPEPTEDERGHPLPLYPGITEDEKGHPPPKVIAHSVNTCAFFRW